MKKITCAVLLIFLAAALSSCVPGGAPENTAPRSETQIYLYGEQHGIDAILEKEFELWHGHYHDGGMRHLFLELPYYTAEFLNIWMQSDGDDILDTVYAEWEDTAGQVPAAKDFYKRIKTDCPETVFHGTDVGHQYDTTGRRFLKYLLQNGRKDTESYAWTKEAILQGRHYYENSDDVYREHKMTENFIRAFDSLGGEKVMGIYGGAHTGLDAMNFTGETPSMANRLREHYGDIIFSEDLSRIRADPGPLRMDCIEISGKSYEASYFGRQILTGMGDYASREYWRLENAYDDFKDSPKTWDVLPYDNYPMAIETGQVFVIDYTKNDGSVIRMYYRSDGSAWQGEPATENFRIG